MRHTHRHSHLGAVACLLVSGTALGATRKVGPGQTYATPCAAFVATADGDVVEIDAAGNGTYDGDVCAVSKNGLTIRGVNGRAHVDAAGKNAQGKGTWVIQGNDVTVENMELSGAAVPDLNGAGIRAEGTNLTVRTSYFHDNQNGILGGAGVVLVEFSEFAKNGNCIDPSGCAHNMYISGATTKFTLQYSYSHDVTDGHLVKSRAKENYILYNRLTGESGTDSYELSMPNAGTTYVIGNLIEQGANTGNPTMLDYGSEGYSNPGKDLYVINNTFVNDRSSGTFVSVSSGAVPAIVKNNVFFGSGTTVSQASAVLANNFSSGDPLLVGRGAFDYRLQSASPCVNAGVDPGSSPTGFSLVPVAEYVHPTGRETRTAVGVIDIGAYELGGGAGAVGGTGGAGGSSTATGGTTAGGGSGAAGGVSSGGSATAAGGLRGSGGSQTASGGVPSGGRTSSTNGSGAASGPDGGTSPSGGSGDTDGCGCRTARGSAAHSLGLGTELAILALCRWRARKARG
jgi:hypothetical protein